MDQIKNGKGSTHGVCMIVPELVQISTANPYEKLMYDPGQEL